MAKEKIDWKPMIKIIPRMLETGVRGVLTVPHWPILSGSLYPPLLEIAGNTRTPNKLLPVVSALYYYIRDTDNTIDNCPGLPTNSQIEHETQDEYMFFLSTVARVMGSEICDNIAGLVCEIKERVYHGLAVKALWKGRPSYWEAYAHRLLQNQAVSELTTMVWCEAVGIKGDQREEITKTAVSTAMVLQHLDDWHDRKQDPKDSGNIVQAIMQEEGEEVPGPRSIRRIRRGINHELEEIKSRSPGVYEILSNLVKFRVLLPAQ